MGVATPLVVTIPTASPIIELENQRTAPKTGMVLAGTGSLAVLVLSWQPNMKWTDMAFAGERLADTGTW